MVLHGPVFRTQEEAPKTVYLVSEGGRFGLMAAGGPEIPDAGGLLRRSAVWVTRPQWEEIRPNLCFAPEDDPPERSPDPARLTCDYWVRKGGRWGLLDEAGTVLLEPLYDEALPVDDPRSADFSPDPEAVSGRVRVRRGDRWGLLGGRGREVLPVAYDAIDVVCYHWARHHVFVVSRDGLYGVTDAYGRFFIPPVYPPLHCPVLDYLWGESVFRVDGATGTGFVRLKDGKCLVEPEWDRVETARLYLPGDDEPAGRIFTVWKNGRCGVILNDRGLIIPPVWDEIVIRRIGFRDPLSYSLRRGAAWGLCDAEGRMVCDAAWDEVDILLDGIACVKKDGKWGAIGADGGLRVPPVWDAMAGFGLRGAMDRDRARSNLGALLGLGRRMPDELPACLSWVRKDGRWGLVDRDGRVVEEPVWEICGGAAALRSGPEPLVLQVREVEDAPPPSPADFPDGEDIPWPDLLDCLDGEEDLGLGAEDLCLSPEDEAEPALPAEEPIRVTEGPGYRIEVRRIPPDRRGLSPFDE